MIGPLLNASGILVGGIVGLAGKNALSPATQAKLQVILSAITVFVGLRLTWLSLNGSVWRVLKQLLIVILALILGRLVGRLLGLQKMSNRLGSRARESITQVRPDSPNRRSTGFKTCAGLFCAAPLGFLGAVQDGISQYVYPLGLKAVIDGLAAAGFVAMFGSGVLVSALPVLALQGTVALACAQVIGPFLASHGLVDSVNAVGGLLVFSVALGMLGLKRIEVTDYLPSLLLAPLITWLWR